MLDNYGLHQLTWNLADQVVSDILVASPMDAEGRGIALSVRQNGAAANLTGATAYLVWTHRQTGKRSTAEFDAVDASVGTFEVFYPAAMCEAAGVVDASVMLSLGDDRYISTRNFLIRVEKVLIDSLEPEDGFTLFVQAIAAYENAADISTEAAQAANQAAADVLAAMQRGDFDGADGQDGADGFSPVATVVQTAGGATITITDANGTTTADIANGAKGDKGDTGAQGPKGDKGDTGEQGPQGIQGETGATGATGAQGPQGEQGPKGDTGKTGATGPKGDTGAAGTDGADGVSCTHSWNGTVLSITSASGTSSADLVGPQGPTGATGETGPAGADGTVFTPVSPLALANGELSVDLSAYTRRSAICSVYDFTNQKALPAERSTDTKLISGVSKARTATLNDVLYDTIRDRVALVVGVSGSGDSVTLGFNTFLDLAELMGIVTTTTLDAAAGSYANGNVGRRGHAIKEGTLVLNTSTGNLMRVTATVIPQAASVIPEVRALGLRNIFNQNVSAGSTYTAASPLSIDANNQISIDLSAYAALAGATFTGAVSGITPTADAHFATKKYVDDAIAALDDLSGVSF